MIEEKLRELLSPTISELGYRIILVEYTQDSPKHKILRILAEREDGENLSISDCQKISRASSEILDEEEPVSGAYNLEVSSPGIDRPLVMLEDYAKYNGYLANVKFKESIDGSSKVKGNIKFDNNEISIIREKDEKLFNTSFENISSARLVITDELLKKQINK
jgi:ribosome maturation factor RimP